MDRIDCSQPLTVRRIVFTIVFTMTFVTYSFFIIGLLASGIPVLLHLLMRGKPKRIVFPPLILIQARLNVTKRNFQLKQILLLLLRILIFVIVGLLLSRPTLKLGD